MNPKSVFQKTEKGRQEIAKRTHRLESRKRMLLIVVDGQSDAEALAAKVAHLEDPLELLEALVAEGFVEPAGGEAVAPAARAPATPVRAGPARTPAAAPSTAALPLEALKRNAVVQIEKLMGPGGEALALKIEAVTTREQFHVEAGKVRDALASLLGQKKADAFAATLGL